MVRLPSSARMIVAHIACALLCTLPAPAYGQELLANRSFENPATLLPGDNLYATLPNWTLADVSPLQLLPVNIVRPNALYLGNPQAPPAGGGSQYLDIAGASARIRQSFTLASASVVSFGGWYAVRDFPRALSGLTVTIRDSGGTAVASGSTSFTAAEPVGLWKQVAVTGVGLAAGTYTFEADIPNAAAFDLASVAVQPPVTMTKTSAVHSDPLNGTANPKAIPDAAITYTVTVATPAYPITAGSLALVETTPPQMALVVSDFGAAGSGPVAFSANASGLNYSFAGLGSAADSLEFSNDGGASWGYVPTPGAGGADPAVTNVRIRPANAMAANSDFSVQLRYLVR